MDPFRQDFRTALRRRAEYPGFGFAAIPALGLGLGMVASLLFKVPAQVAHPARGSLAAAGDPRRPHSSASSWMDYIDFRRGSGDVLEDLGCHAPRPFTDPAELHSPLLGDARPRKPVDEPVVVDGSRPLPDLERRAYRAAKRISQ